MHRPSRSLTWLQRAGCAGAIAGVVVLGVCRAAPNVHVEASSDAGVCAALQVVAATTLYDRVPPLEAPPELEEAVRELNNDLARARAAIEEACRG